MTQQLLASRNVRQTGRRAGQGGGGGGGGCFVYFSQRKDKVFTIATILLVVLFIIGRV